MNQESRYKQSRDQWKRKAGERAEVNRYNRKELARVKRERDQYKKEAKDAQARIRELETRPPVVCHKVDLVFLAVQLFLVARISYRAVSRVLGVMAEALGIKKALLDFNLDGLNFSDYMGPSCKFSDCFTGGRSAG